MKDVLEEKFFEISERLENPFTFAAGQIVGEWIRESKQWLATDAIMLVFWVKTFVEEARARTGME